MKYLERLGCAMISIQRGMKIKNLGRTRNMTD
jgi:hypothetical protein